MQPTTACTLPTVWTSNRRSGSSEAEPGRPGLSKHEARDLAYILAIDKVAQALARRGIYP